VKTKNINKLSPPTGQIRVDMIVIMLVFDNLSFIS